MTFLLADPTTALTLARYHQEDIRRSIPRKPRTWWPTRPTHATPAPGITAVPALAQTAQTAQAEAEVAVPGQREESARLLAG